MQKIILHSPALDNAGAYHDSGATIEVGKGPAQIDQARAEALVRGAAGSWAPEPEKPDIPDGARPAKAVRTEAPAA